MTTTGVPGNAKQLAMLVKQGEGPALEFKRSTGELKEGMQTLCSFLNGSGGTVLFGVRPDGTIEGQAVSDQTLRDIAQAADRFEPPAHVSIHRVKIKAGRDVIVVAVECGRDMCPFTHEGHAYERVSSTTRRMPQAKYERLLVERGHAKRRWENLPADGLTLKDLDRKEILRTRELAIQQNRISPDTSRDIGEILDRLGLRIDGVLTHAAIMLYGKRFLPDYPQCLLKLGRFRGTEITGEIVDNRQENMNAFAMVREGMAFLERTMPLGARFPTGKIFREDRFPVPLDAFREILLNAVMHRDYSHYSGYVAIAVFDDKIEIRSYGRLPNGITVKQLSGKHDSKPVNPLIAGAFHRTGAVEVWGRGTNRVIAACKKHGAVPPTFSEQSGFLTVTFKAQMVAGGTASQLRDQLGTKLGLSRDQVEILRLCCQEQPLVVMMKAAGRQNRTKFRDGLVKPLVELKLLEMTSPDKPQSRLQKYKITETGLAVLKKKTSGATGRARKFRTQ
ncbi:MAG: putative DNA binding domain-containing protein [Planctomycetes bacterium]|nr:putative DNA binding domain-containing protein [Planctomycetota bacterium]